jgi:hypothetical protein
LAGNLEKKQEKKRRKKELFPFSCFQDREHRLKLFRFLGQTGGGGRVSILSKWRAKEREMKKGKGK